ncbi:hypothetical protein [Streptomyces griseocarneus]|uniref:hypothetical protein n=1 Tax=Streptomyces griseocarneus TaxID=51201 RepID=UPI00167D339F|nr:hypothetical protein [Streptomyces griseocarneus]MBZ6478027.1 hypothetical protein [Streptomyces griseocarneus]GHG64183.1 hypothetical protein GCM10018779_33930 [Streptomyces griseocarneus]
MSEEVTIGGLEAQLIEVVELVGQIADQDYDRAQRLEGLIAGLQEQIDELTGGTGGPGASGGVPLPQGGGTDGEETPVARPWAVRATAAEWTELADWVDWLQNYYQLKGENQIAVCWPQHGGAIEELAGLHSSWKAAMLADERAEGTGDQSGYWHDRSLWDTLGRVSRAVPNACRNTGHTAARPLPVTDRGLLPQPVPQPR